MGARPVQGLVRPLALFLLLVLASAPSAAARTLSDFEEPYRGSDVSGGVVAFTVTEEEADTQRALIYRNDPRSAFNLSIVDEAGEVVYSKRGTRGVQTLPGLAAGDYRFTIGGEGEFQVTEKAVRELGTHEATLGGGADAYIVALPVWANVTVRGDVVAEAWNLQAFEPVTLAPNGTVLAPGGGAVVLTLRGESGAPYSIDVEEAAAPPSTRGAGSEETPAPALLSVLLAGAGAALARARRGLQR